MGNWASDQQIVDDFLAESFENLQGVSNELLRWEKNPADQEVFNSIYRKIHTLKGSCGFLELKNLESVADILETLLERTKQGGVVRRADFMDFLLQAVEICLGTLQAIKSGGLAAERDCQELATKGLALMEHFFVGTALMDGHLVAGAPGKVEEPRQQDDRKATREPAPPVNADGEDASVRVKVSLLDKIVRTVGELVLGRNHVLNYADGKRDSTLSVLGQKLSGITTELQNDIMKVRMGSLGALFASARLMVRELAKEKKRKIELDIQGQGAELDRNLIAVIKDPLMHLMRNAIDHGIRDDGGTVRIRAGQESGQMVIEVSDDGRGIDVEEVFQKALALGVVAPEDAPNYGVEDKINLIFTPGFSTAQSSSRLSGRGVGLDVVKANVEGIGGLVQVRSTVGEGTTFTMRIPLTLAVVTALTFRAGGGIFAINQENIVVIERFDKKQVEHIQQDSFLRFHSTLLPIFNLSHILGLTERQGGYVLVLRDKGCLYGLIVDDVIDNQDVFLRPFGRAFVSQHIYSGASITDKGEIALVLDVRALYGMLEVDFRETDEGQKPTREELPAKEDNLILFRTGEDCLYGVSLHSVDRLERFKWSAIEWAGNLAMVPYKDEALPLYDWSLILKKGRLCGPFKPDRHSREMLNVIVFNLDGERVGLVVDEMMGNAVVRGEVKTQKAFSPYLIGSVYVEGKLVALVDPENFSENGGAARWG